MVDNEKEKMLEQITDFRVFMAETVVYRKEQSSRMDRMAAKIDKIFNHLEGLPCKERAWIPINIYAIWGIIGTIGVTIFLAWIK